MYPRNENPKPSTEELLRQATKVQPLVVFDTAHGKKGLYQLSNGIFRQFLLVDVANKKLELEQRKMLSSNQIEERE